MPNVYNNKQNTIHNMLQLGKYPH
uniref:Uncharacterized protein n=1 Tax=Anguilla anguilla TaxID=7936 RepID=A0A0E9RBG2_ANGAN